MQITDLILNEFRGGSHVKPVLDKLEQETGFTRAELYKKIAAACTLGLLRQIVPQKYETVEEVSEHGG